MWQRQPEEWGAQGRARGKGSDLPSDISWRIGGEELRIRQFLDARVEKGNAQEQPERGQHERGQGSRFPRLCIARLVRRMQAGAEWLRLRCRAGGGGPPWLLPSLLAAGGMLVHKPNLSCIRVI